MHARSSSSPPRPGRGSSSVPPAGSGRPGPPAGHRHIHVLSGFLSIDGPIFITDDKFYSIVDCIYDFGTNGQEDG